MNPSFPLSNVRTTKSRSPYGLGNRESEDEKRSSEDVVPPSHAGVVVSLEPNDVILGRGFRYAWHSGNNAFQALVRDNITRYNEAVRKNDKSRIVQEIYKRVTLKGRFLKKTEPTGLYAEVEEHVAKEKISQAIRYKKRRSVRSDQTGAGPSSSSVSSTNTSASTPQQTDLIDNATLQSVLGRPEQFEWPDISQFEIISSFDVDFG